MAASKVISVSQVADGLHVDVTLDAAPAGAVTAKVSRLPLDPAAVLVTVTHQSGNVYRVKVRDGLTKLAISARLNYYLSLFDGVTRLTSYQLDRSTGPALESCEWVCKTDNSDWMDQTEQAVLDILLDNIQAINRGMEIWLGETELPSGVKARIQAVHTGEPAYSSGSKYPQIALSTSEIQDDPYFANPRSDYLPLKTAISCYLCHESDVNWLPFVRACGMAVFNVLNQIYFVAGPNVEIELPCGLTLYECYATVGECAETWDDSAGVWVARFTTNWQSKLFVGRELQ